jgi:hypothetical protein
MLLLVNHACKKNNLDIDKCQLINSISLTQTSWFTSFNGSYEESHGHFILKLQLISVNEHLFFLAEHSFLKYKRSLVIG